MMLAMILGLLTACEVCVAEGCNGDAEGCAALTAVGCESDPRCTEILAEPLYETGTTDSGETIDYCLETGSVQEFVACRDAGLGCTETPTIATDADGFGWYLDNDCLPTDWREQSWQELDEC